MSDIHWIILGYLAIGLAFVEGIRWARGKWKVEPLNKLSTGLVFVAWPLVIVLALVLTWRGKNGR